MSDVAKIKTWTLANVVWRLYLQLKSRGHYDLARQLLRSGTSPAANHSEGYFCDSPRERIRSWAVAKREAGECHFWLSFLVHNQILGDDEEVTASLKQASSLCQDIIKILSKAITTMKTKLQQPPSPPTNH
jgi:four helix bundle protein